MLEYTDVAEKLKCTPIIEITDEDDTSKRIFDGDNIKIMGIITSCKKKITKNDSTMAYVTVEDTSGSIELLVFPKVYDTYANVLKDGEIFVFTGRVSIREDEEPKVICSTVKRPEDGTAAKKSAESSQKKKRHGLFLKFNDENDINIVKAEKYLSIFDGNTPLYYYYNSTKKYALQPTSKFVYINEPLIKELRNLLGDSNVVAQ